MASGEVRQKPFSTLRRATVREDYIMRSIYTASSMAAVHRGNVHGDDFDDCACANICDDQPGAIQRINPTHQGLRLANIAQLSCATPDSPATGLPEATQRSKTKVCDANGLERTPRKARTLPRVRPHARGRNFPPLRGVSCAPCEEVLRQGPMREPTEPCAHASSPSWPILLQDADGRGALRAPRTTWRALEALASQVRCRSCSQCLG